MKRLWNLWRDYQDLIEVYFWLLAVIPTLLWWKESILWVALMSLYANTKTAHGAWKAEQAKRAAEDNETALKVD